MGSSPSKPFLVEATNSRSGPVLNVLGIPTTVKVFGTDTDGQLAQFLLPVPPRSGPPLHRHTREDEYFYLLAGEITWEVDADRISGGPGTVVFAPRGSQHTFQNFGDKDALMLVTVTPSGLERFFQEIHALCSVQANPDLAEVKRIMASYGIELCGPPLS